MSAAVKALSDVLARIAEALTESGRGGDETALVAVSKTRSAEEIEPVINAGQRAFGENRVQEAQGKWPALKARHLDVVLHLIGPLQSNKAGDAVALFDVIQSVDRPKIARTLANEMTTQGRHLPVFVQVNIGEEPQKAGVAPVDAADFVNECRDLGLNVVGLMCIPPADAEPAPYFALLRELAARAGLTGLSMGMSGDFDIAITLGATHVRVGTAVFGPRA